MKYPAPNRSRRLVPALLIGAAVIEAIMLQVGGRIHNNDFKHLWAGSKLLAMGGNPYDPSTMLKAVNQWDLDAVNPFVYLPATGLLLRPITWMPFGLSAWTWFVFNYALAWLCVLAAPRLLRLENPRMAQWTGAMFLLGSLPFYRQMTAGQLNVVLLAAMLASLGLLIRRRDMMAGAVLGLAAALKISPIFLIFVLAGMRRWKAAAAAAVSFGLIVLISVAWCGPEMHWEALSVLSQMRYGHSTWAALDMQFYRDPFNQSFNSLFHHLLSADPRGTIQPWLNLGPAAANFMTWVASGLMLFALFIWIGRYRRRPYFRREWSEAESGLFLIGALIMLLLPSLMWDHYTVQALAALIWFAGSAHWTRRFFQGFTLIVVFYLLAYFPWYHDGGPNPNQGWGVALISLRLWGTLGLLSLVHQQWRFYMLERRMIEDVG